jgi:hypothetical protein
MDPDDALNILGAFILNGCPFRIFKGGMDYPNGMKVDGIHDVI